MNTLASNVSMNLRCCFVELKRLTVQHAKVIGWLSCLACRQLTVSIRSLPVLLNYLRPAVDCRNVVVAAVLVVKRLP